jgi:hypothetical protein
MVSTKKYKSGEIECGNIKKYYLFLKKIGINERVIPFKKIKFYGTRV